MTCLYVTATTCDEQMMYAFYLSSPFSFILSSWHTQSYWVGWIVKWVITHKKWFLYHNRLVGLGQNKWTTALISYNHFLYIISTHAKAITNIFHLLIVSINNLNVGLHESYDSYQVSNSKKHCWTNDLIPRITTCTCLNVSVRWHFNRRTQVVIAMEPLLWRWWGSWWLFVVVDGIGGIWGSKNDFRCL